MRPLTLGTAGHIDHGKTALVSALTGVDTDRLPEERRRGISIELGYAALTLDAGPPARRLSVVDVPGHERFVRTMVAGATGVDLFLMAIAADDGVMPQTREHAAVLRALGVSAGVVAVTKADVADPARACAQARELHPGAAVVAVSARTGHGLEDLRAALAAAAARAAGRGGDGPAVLHADRVFTIHGAGTVVTGTLWSGTIGRGDELLVLPRARRARVRGVQVHDAPVERAGAGQRLAVNLVLRRDEVDRGDVLVGGDGPGAPRPTYRLDARLDCDPRDPRVTVHHGTRETPARPVHLGGDDWQLRLQSPLVAAAGDRLVIRSIAPPDTLGGGVVLDPTPPRHRQRTDTAQQSSSEQLHEAAQSTGPAARRCPAVSGEEKGETGVRPASPERARQLEATEAVLRAAGHEPPPDSALDASHLEALRAHGRVVRVGPAMHVHVEALAEVERRLRALLEREQRITLAQFRDELGTSRKYAQALLEHFDSERVTLRAGEERVLRKRSRRPG